MKVYELNLESYKVGDAELDVREEFYTLLRLPGIYADGVETCDGIILAKSIQRCAEPVLEINAEELALMKKVMDTLIARPHKPQIGQISLGGPRYEELILRVFMLDRKE
jgi:hypothetical protein